MRAQGENMIKPGDIVEIWYKDITKYPELEMNELSKKSLAVDCRTWGKVISISKDELRLAHSDNSLELIDILIIPTPMIRKVFILNVVEGLNKEIEKDVRQTG